MISAAMLAKNEAHILDRCLASIKPFVSEIILVDTGSTDSTVEVAKKYTDKIYHEPWRNDFAFHRNHSFGLCSQPWILGIDPDEEFIFENKMTPQALLDHLKNNTENVNAVGMEIRDWRESRQAVAACFDGLRFFRKGCIKWKRRVHNQPDVDGEAALMRDAHIKHYGYDLTPEQAQAKAKRTIGLLELSLEDDPNDYDSMFYMAQAYGAFLNDKDNALKWGREYINHHDQVPKFNTSIYHLVAAICAHKKFEDECHGYITQGLSEDPWDLDLLYDMMHYGLRQGDRTTLATAAQKFILCYENFNKYRFKHPGKFFFNYNTVAYSSALFYASTSMIENGAVIYRRLRKLMGDLPAPIKTEIDQKLAEAFDRAKFNDNLHTGTPSTPPPRSAPPPVFQVPQNLELPAL